MNITPQNPDPNHGNGNGTPPAHGANSGSHGDQSPQLSDLQKQLAELQSKNAEYLADNQKYRQAKKEQDEAAQAAEEARLKEQNQFKELAEKASTRVKELEPVKERYEQLSTLLADQIKAQTKDWPKEVKDLLPSDDTPIEVRYSQVQKLQSLAIQLADKAQAQQRASLPGNTPGPRQANQEQSRDQQKQEFRIRRAKSGQYGL